MKTNIILQGDALTKLKELPNESVDCVMTSPPYWALRDYGVEGQLGLEPTFNLYIKHLCDIFDEVKRVLKKTGTCWVNLGDTYYGSGKGAGGDISKSKECFTFKEKEKRICDNCGKEFEGWKFQNFCGSACSGVDNTPRTKKGKLPGKTLTMIPARFQIEMVNRGWICRNTIIWHKPNAMPTSAKDRFTVDFEYIFFFTKNKKYNFEQQFEPLSDVTINDIKKRKNMACITGKNGSKEFNQDTPIYQVPKKGRLRTDFINLDKGRNKRTTWVINPKPFKEAHFAVYPEELCETPIKAGCPEGGTVLDPFFGSGTTGLVALKQNKKFIGIELNPEYIEIAAKRLKPFMEQTTLIQPLASGESK